MVAHSPPPPPDQGASVRSQIFFCQGPPSRTTPRDHQLPTTNRHQLPTTNRC